MTSEEDNEESEPEGILQITQISKIIPDNNDNYMRADIEKKAKTCSACINAGKNLKTQLPNTEKSKIEPPKNPAEDIQIDFTGNLNSKQPNLLP